MAQSDDKCKRSTCSKPRQGGTGQYSAFCSKKCGLKHEHVKADARDARRDAERGSRDRHNPRRF